MKTLVTLEKAFAAMERRLASVPSRESPQPYTWEMWQLIEKVKPLMVPKWYQELTVRFVVGGACFDYPVDSKRRHLNGCAIADQPMLLEYSSTPKEIFNLYAELASHGYFGFAWGQDGNQWIFRSDAVEDPPVYVLELTAWDSSEPTPENGLISPKITLGELLSFGALSATSDCNF